MEPTPQAAPRGNTWRTVLAGLLLFAGAWGIVFGTGSLWFRSHILDAEGFADFTTELLDEAAVQDAITNAITTPILDGAPKALRANREQLRQATLEVVSGEEFATTTRTAIVGAHRVLFGEEGSEEVALDLSDAMEHIEQQLAAVNPKLAAQLPDASRLEHVASLEQGLDTIRTAGRVARAGALMIPVVGVAATALGFLVSPRRLHAARTFGIEVAVLAGTMLASIFLAKSGVEAIAGFEQSTGAFDSAWGVLTGEITVRMIILTAGGVALAAGAWFIDRFRAQAA